LPRRVSSDRQSFPEGYTLVEALVAIALLAALTGLAYLLIDGSARASFASIDEASAASAALVADGLLRNAARRVRIPFWVEASSLEFCDGIPYVDGDPEKRLSFRIDEGSLLILVGDERLVAAGVSSVEIQALGPAQGIDATIVVSGREYQTKAIFGAMPNPWAGP
jgi:hypothetical protein